MVKKYFSKTDLAKRWGVSPQVVYNWEQRYKDFPKPAIRVSNDHFFIYHLSDIEKYEKLKNINVKGVDTNE